MKKIFILCSVLLLLLLGLPALAINYYVSSALGQDNRTAAQAQNASTPWQSIAKINSFTGFNVGDKVLFNRGEEYNGTLSITVDGVTIGNYGTGNLPLFNGFISVSGWTALGNGLYESSVLATGSTLHLVTINNAAYAMGRYPNSSYLHFETHTDNSITDLQNTIDASWNNATLVLRTTHSSLEQVPITGISGNTITYNNATQDYSLLDNYGYFVENSIKTLDQFGEWYYDPASKKITMFFGNVNPAVYVVKATGTDQLMQPKASNLIIDGIAFTGANNYAIFNDWQGLSNLIIKNCTFDFSGIDAILLANRNGITIDNCTVDHSNSQGINLGDKNDAPVLINSTVDHTGNFPGMLFKDAQRRMGNGVFVAACVTTGLTAKNNKILNSGYDGIFFDGNNVLIQNNYIDNFCSVMDDGGGIYTANYTPKGQTPVPNFNQKIIGNIILHAIGVTEGTAEAFKNTGANYNMSHGVYLDDNGTNTEVRNNSIAYCGYAGIFIHNANTFTIETNHIFNAYTAVYIQDDNIGGPVYGGVINDNWMENTGTTGYMYYLASEGNNFPTMATFTNNKLSAPFFSSSNLMHQNYFGHPETLYTFATWQATGNDIQGTLNTTTALTNPADIVLQYNATNSPKTFTLQFPFVDLGGTNFTSGSVVLAPYTSTILLKKPPVVVITPPPANAMAGSVIPMYADHFIYKSRSGKTAVTFNIATDNVKGFMFNTSNGAVEFRRGCIKLSETQYLIGDDTLNIPQQQSANASGAAGGDLYGSYPSPSVDWSHGLSSYDLYYLKSTDAAGTYATQASLGSYLLSSTAAGTYATQSSLNAYLLSSDAASTYATKASLTGFIKSTDAAGGDLTGTYPSPSVDWSHAYTTLDNRYLKIGQATGGNATGAAGGDLYGSYPSPSVDWSHGLSSYDLYYLRSADAASTYASKTGSTDIEITDFTKGIILRTSDGTRARITLIKYNGQLTLQVSDPL